MSNPSPIRLRLQPRGETLLIKYALVWVLAAAVLSVGELIALDALTAPVLAVDTIAGVQLPFGLLSLFVTIGPAASETAQEDEDPADEDDVDDGGGGAPDDLAPLAPTGGLDIDWERFEADVNAYAQSLEPACTP